MINEKFCPFTDFRIPKINYCVYLQRFQKTYEALEQEGMAEKKQLIAIHQQRVTADLNDKKRIAMEHYMDVSSSLYKI